MALHGNAWNRVKICVEIVLMVAVGVLLFRALDLQRLQASLERLTPAAVIGIIGFQGALLCLAVLRWALLLRGAGIYRGIWRTGIARLCGFSLGYLTPVFLFAGIPARAAAYRDGTVKEERLYATIGVDYGLEIVGKLPVIAVGLYCLLLLLRPGALPAAIGALVLAVVLGIGAALGARLLRVSPAVGCAGLSLPAFLQRLAPRLSSRVAGRLRSFRLDLSAIARQRSVLARAFMVSVCVALLEVGQTYFLLGILGHPSVPFALVIFASILVSGIIGVMPGNLGGMEGAHVAVFALLGLGASEAVFYTIVLRVGQLALVIVGVLALCAIRFGRGRHTVPGTTAARSAAIP